MPVSTLSTGRAPRSARARSASQIALESDEADRRLTRVPRPGIDRLAQAETVEPRDRRDVVQRPDDLARAQPVRVGLDHRDDRNPRAGGDGLRGVAHARQVDLHDRAVNEAHQ
jgi:hypothetical protein